MADTAVSTPGAPAGENGSGGGSSSNASYLNSFRISAAAGRLAMHVSPPEINDVVEFCQLCLSLARGIDRAIASNDVPTKATELPSLFKQVCRRKSDPFMQAAVMVLMISVKSACQNGWFSDKDSEDLRHLANEISSSFCSTPDFNCEPSGSLCIISTVMSRFFPLLKMGEIFAFLEVTAGYGTFINDFYMSKNVKTSPEDKIRLLVAQIDNTETSSCLISPSQAIFLLNGKGVEKRTNATDTGPQVPTVVSHMLKYGTNLLQAVGEFNGNYIVVIAFMSMRPTPDPATLPDYVHPAPASVDPDSEIIEGPSRISLNCPISFRRIKAPAKGQSCKHLQCFDYHNYIDINSRRPSWRCPHCNQHVCFTDIRIDQDMAKVLKEVGKNITDVVLSSDGSWKAIMESDGHTDNTPSNNPKFSKDETILPDSGGVSNLSSDIMDLTEIDDEMDVVGTVRLEEDHKGFQTNSQDQPFLAPNNPTQVNQTPSVNSDFWSGLYLSTFELGTSRSSSNPQQIGVSEPIPTNLMPSPALTNALIPASVTQGGDSSPNSNSLQLQQFQFGNSGSNTNEYGRMPSITRHAVSRAAIAVQALPAQAPSPPVPQQRPRNNDDSSILNSSSQASQATSVVTNNSGPSNIERQQSFSRANSNMVQSSHAPSAALPNKQQVERSFAHMHPTQQIFGHKNPAQSHTPFGPPGFAAEPLNAIRQGLFNNQHTTSHTPKQSQQGLSRSPASFSRINPQSNLQVGGPPARGSGVVSSQHLQPMLTAQRTAQVARPVQLSRSAAPPSSVPRNAEASSRGVSISSFTGGGGDQRGGNTVPVDLGSGPDKDWRPVGRMRGSLSGRAFSEALEHYIPIQQPPPTTTQQQQAQSPRPSLPPHISPQLQALLANRLVGHSSTTSNQASSSTPAATPDVSAVLPPHSSSGMQ
ncbi:unnamed protein product [Cuscuta epithymum]|uniref:SP-RING-type domain-containing protein n=2 Tax=Cuscuta epithymum TaxID=186058 RepID=A0AAV0D6A4_9ASTE|nr:unnamed protein product [Cuscuta epithymum]